MDSVVYFRANNGQDPEELQMLANTYHWKIVWLKGDPKPVKVIDGTAAVTGALVLMVSTLLAVIFHRRFWAMMAAMVTLVVTLPAQQTASGNGASASASASWASNTFSLAYTVSGAFLTTPDNHHAVGLVAWHTVVASGTVYTSDLATLEGMASALSGGASTSGTATGTVGSGSWVWYAAVAYDEDTGILQQSNGWLQAGVVTHTVKFHLPANAGSEQLYYVATQDGVTVGQTEQVPGAAGRDWTITVPNGDGVDLSIISGGYVGDDGSSTPVVTPDTVLNHIGNATPTTGTASPVTPSNPDHPANTTPATDPNAAPTDTPPPATPTHAGDGSGDPGNTAAATGGDVTQGSNAVIHAINTLSDNVTAGDGTVVTAINNASTANIAAHNNLLIALNKQQVSADKIAANTDSMLQALNGSPVADHVFPSTGATLLPGLPVNATLNSSLIGKLPTAPTLTSLTPTSIVSINFTVPKLLGGNAATVSQTVDFGAEPYHTPITIFRSCMLVVVTLTFFIVTFYTVRGAVTTAK